MSSQPGNPSDTSRKAIENTSERSQGSEKTNSNVAAAQQAVAQVQKPVNPK